MPRSVVKVIFQKFQEVYDFLLESRLVGVHLILLFVSLMIVCSLPVKYQQCMCRHNKFVE